MFLTWLLRVGTKQIKQVHLSLNWTVLNLNFSLTHELKKVLTVKLWSLNLQILKY